MKRFFITVITILLLLTTTHHARAAEEREDHDSFILVDPNTIYSKEEIEIGENLLHAIYHNKIELVEKCIAFSVPIDYQDGNGNTGLMIAAALGNPIMVEVLLNEHASISIENRYSENALEKLLSIETFFIKSSHEKVIELLVSHGTDLHKKNIDGKTIYDKLRQKLTCPQTGHWYSIAQNAEEKAQKSLTKTIWTYLPSLPTLPSLPFCARKLLR